MSFITITNLRKCLTLAPNIKFLVHYSVQISMGNIYGAEAVDKIV